MTTTTAGAAISPGGGSPKRGVTLSDWKVFAAIAGGSFFANLVALITVVHVMLAPVKISIQNNTDRLDRQGDDMDVIAAELHVHERSFGHEGMEKLIERVEAQLQRLESQGG